MIQVFIANVRSGNPVDLPLVPRQTGTWNHADLEWIAAKVTQIPGDFAEIGVFQGAAFRKVAALAAQQNKRAHAFDSFTGMNEPTAFDGGSYPKGMFDVGGPEGKGALWFAANGDRAGLVGMDGAAAAASCCMSSGVSKSIPANSSKCRFVFSEAKLFNIVNAMVSSFSSFPLGQNLINGLNSAMRYIAQCLYRRRVIDL